MSVYVDELIIYTVSDKVPRCFRGKASCHMYADTIEELHQMALKIGMKLEWFQADRRLPHYDLVASRRARAVKMGAIEHTRNQMVCFMRGELIQEAMRLPGL